MTKKQVVGLSLLGSSVVSTWTTIGLVAAGLLVPKWVLYTAVVVYSAAFVGGVVLTKDHNKSK